ncbi:MAG TPA: FAD:protein FMN transferase [Acetobacteraceae bacterium]|jgi:thiamine biosynthesis lipoprotein
MTTPGRRRFITIAAAAAGMPLLLLPRGRAADVPRLRVWTGSALGADAMLQINHPDPAVADRLIEHSLAEVERLEHVFSLYQRDSALSRLNENGHLDDPPFDLVRLLGECARFSTLTGGAFDVTVQPLWALYAAHFAQPDANPAGPSRAAIETALARVGHTRVLLDARRIAFAASGMALTLNGIAQGYVTDRVVDLLRDAGIASALVDMGETRAIGAYPEGQPWSIGLEDPRAPGRVAERIDLIDRAVATSGGYGTQFDPAGRFNHIFDPSNGTTSWRYAAVSVVAADATTADALSTAFTLMPLDRTRLVVDALNLRAHFAFADGARLVQSRSPS